MGSALTARGSWGPGGLARFAPGSGDLFASPREDPWSCSRCKRRQWQIAPEALSGSRTSTVGPKVSFDLFDQKTERLLPAAGFGPAGQQRGAQASARSDVRVLIGRDVDAFVAGAVDDLYRLRALAPDVGAERLDVRDVYGNLRLAAYADHLFYRSEQPDGI